MKLLKYISLICIVFIGLSSYGQNDFGKAYDFYKVQQFDSARVYVDAAVQSEDKNNSQAWQLRGIIYRSLEVQGSLVNREIAIESFVTSRNVDTIGQYTKEIANYLYNINVRYYNDAVIYMKKGQLDESESSYLTYKENYTKILLLEYDFKAKDIGFYTAIGGAWFMKNTQVEISEKPAVYEKAISFFEKALELDSLNYSANYGIGVAYYNQGADLITNMNPFESDLEEIDKVQNQSIEMFKKGEPYLIRAFEINPNEKEVVEGLTGIYYSLNQDDEYNYFKDLLENMEEK